MLDLLCKKATISKASANIEIQSTRTAWDKEKAKALTAFYVFSGADKTGRFSGADKTGRFSGEDKTGRFSGIGKITWFRYYLKVRSDNHHIFSEPVKLSDELIALLAKFMSSGYCPKGFT